MIMSQKAARYRRNGDAETGMENVCNSGCNAEAGNDLHDAFVKIDSHGVKTSEALKKDPDLYNEFGLQLYHLIETQAIHTRTSRRKNGGHSAGNYAKIKFLNSRRIPSEDIVQSIYLHILEHLDKVLSAPLEVRVFYVKRIINNKIVDILRALPPDTESLDVPVNKEEPFGDTVLDRLRYHPLPTARQIWQKEQHGRSTLYGVVKSMAGHPEELLVFLGRQFLNYSNRELCCMFRETGIQATSCRILNETCREFELNSSILLPLFPVQKLSAQGFGFTEDLSGNMARQLSRLSSRGKTYLQHHNFRN